MVSVSRFKQKRPLLSRLFIDITRILLLFLFAYTLTAKLMNFASYRISMEWQPFPLFLSHFLTWLVPLMEAIISILLLFSKTVKKGFIVAGILLAAFTVYSGLVVSGYYQKTPCPCGGLVSGLSWIEHLLLNGSCLIITIVSLRLFSSMKKPKNIAQSGDAEHLYKPVGTIFKRKFYRF